MLNPEIDIFLDVCNQWAEILHRTKAEVFPSLLKRAKSYQIFIDDITILQVIGNYTEPWGNYTGPWVITPDPGVITLDPGVITLDPGVVIVVDYAG